MQTPTPFTQLTYDGYAPKRIGLAYINDPQMFLDSMVSEQFRKGAISRLQQDWVTDNSTLRQRQPRVGFHLKVLCIRLM